MGDYEIRYLAVAKQPYFNKFSISNFALKFASGGSLPDVLQQATVKVIENVKCKGSYPTLVSSMLCAAAPGTDSCQVLLSFN